MGRQNTVVNAELIRVRTIQANSLQINKLQFRRSFNPKGGGCCFKVKGELRELKHDVHEFKHELHKDVRKLKDKIRELKHELHEEVRRFQNQIGEIQEELISGLVPNPALQAFFQSKRNQTVTVTTSSGAIIGIVVLVGTDAVELRESNGDLVLIPYSHITSVF